MATVRKVSAPVFPPKKDEDTGIKGVCFGKGPDPLPLLCDSNVAIGLTIGQLMRFSNFETSVEFMNGFNEPTETRQKNEDFGSSLLLANSPMSPKIVDGSFAAIYDTADVFNDCMKTFGKLRLEPRDSPAMRRRIRGILMSGKQFSLDSRMDLVQGYVSSGRHLSEPVNDFPLVEDDDGDGKCESTLNTDKPSTAFDGSSRCGTIGAVSV